MELAQDFAKIDLIRERIEKSMTFLPQNEDGEAAKKFANALTEGLGFELFEANVISVLAFVMKEEELEAAIAFSKTP